MHEESIYELQPMSFQEEDFLPAVRIPAKDPVQLQLIQLAAASIPSTEASNLVRLLSSDHPLPPHLKHLKRVRSQAGRGGSKTVDILLSCLPCQAALTPCSAASEGQPASLDEDIALPERLEQLVSQHKLQPFVTPAPLHAPETREQWEEWCRVWPVSWRVPDQSAAAASAPSTLPASDQAYFARHMAAALGRTVAAPQAAAAGRPAAVARSSPEALRPGGGNAAVIVDPVSGRVVAQALPDDGHPLGHAAMLAIAAAAERDRLTWPDPSPPSVSAAVPPEDGAADLDRTNAALPASAAPSLRSDRRAGKRPRLLEDSSPLSESPTPHTERADSAAAGTPEAQPSPSAPETAAPSCSEQPAGAAAAAADSPRPYMCTGYDAFLVREPCIMCAMALVHARVARVVFCVPDAAHGALGGGGPLGRLHAQRSLNHHYLVYRLALREGEGGGEPCRGD